MADGEQVFITYEGRTGERRFRNTERLTIRHGQVIEAEVYFGWSIPHKAALGGFVERSDESNP